MVKDTLGGSEVFLGFTGYYGGVLTDSLAPQKKTFIKSTSKEERDYLRKVFSGEDTAYRYSAHDGDYELFYPYSNGTKTVVLYFSDYSRYGKI